MEALLLKDLCVLWKQMRMMLLILAFLSVVGGAFNSVFVVVWCALLPYTAIAYDERSHWDQFAAMMPYRRKDIVLSKYVLGWLCMAASAVVCFVMQTLIGLYSSHVTSIPTLLVSLCLGVICMDVTMPMIFRFGVERGRMVFMLVIFGTAIVAGIAMDVVVTLPNLSIPFFWGILIAAAAVLTVVSVSLSMKLYKAS